MADLADLRWRAGGGWLAGRLAGERGLLAACYAGCSPKCDALLVVCVRVYVQVPPSTLLVWLSPPPRDTTKYSNWSGRPASWPAEWIHMFARVAGDVGLLKPAGPAHHVDLYGIALGEGAGFQLPDQMQGGPALHPAHPAES